MNKTESPDQLGPRFWELARQALSSTSRGYDLLADKFEYTDYATPTDMIEACLDWAQAHFPLDGGTTRGADLACGTGRATRALAARCTQVDGFDFSPGMLEQAAKLSQVPINWLCQDLAHLELTEGLYHRIVTFGAWGHVLQSFREHLLQTILTGLAPGGVFVTITPNEPSLWTRRYWASLAFDTGIRLRNLLWFEEFHMYYRLNNTRDLETRLRDMMGEDYVLILIDPLRLEPSFRFWLFAVNPVIDESEIKVFA